MPELVDIALAVIGVIMVAGFVSGTYTGLLIASVAAASMTTSVVVYWSVRYHPGF